MPEKYGYVHLTIINQGALKMKFNTAIIHIVNVTIYIIGLA
jgi:hypothetical protein